MSKKKKKNKKTQLNPIQKKIKILSSHAPSSTIWLGIAGGAIISGMVFAGIRSGFIRSKYEAAKN